MPRRMLKQLLMASSWYKDARTEAARVAIRDTLNACALLFFWINYFSWSKTINGVTAKPLSYCGNCLHILANTKNEYAFDVFGFLYHIITYRYKFIPSQDYDIRILCRYEEEEEIVFPVAKNTIISVSIENVKDLNKYPNNNLIKENEWFRK